MDLIIGENTYPLEDSDTVVVLKVDGDVKKVLDGKDGSEFENKPNPHWKMKDMRAHKTIAFFTTSPEEPPRPDHDPLCWRWVHKPDCKMVRQWYICPGG